MLDPTRTVLSSSFARYECHRWDTRVTLLDCTDLNLLFLRFMQVDTPWLDGAHVVFGKVTAGLDVVDKIEAVGSQSGRTSKTVIVKDCGEL